MKKFIIILALCILARTSSAATVDFDVTGNNTGDIVVGDTTFNVNVTSTNGTVGTNLLWIGIGWQDDGGLGGQLGAVTVDGGAATFYASIVNAGKDEVYYSLVSAGAHTVNAAVDGTPGGGIFITMGVSSYKNVHTTVPLGTASTNSGTVTPVTVNVTGASASNMVADTAYKGPGLGALTVGAGQTQDWNVTQTSRKMAGSHETSAVGTVTMSWALSKTVEWATVAGEILLAPTPAAIITTKYSILGRTDLLGQTSWLK